MKNKRSIIITLAALIITSYVIYDHFFTSTVSDGNQQRLEEYLANDGLDPREKEEYIESDEYGAYPGRMAPPFSLPSWDDTGDIQLSDYLGNFVIVNAWASWCGPCRDEIPYLIDFHENYSDENVVVLGVNMTTTEASESRAITFINEFNIPYDIAMDFDGLMLQEYEIISMPMTFVVDPEGRIVIRKLGYMDYDMIVEMYKEAIEIYREA
ncbi:thiol-disulfide isomerase/thioredoxin [Evansella vedderi]|uniref:Thiol-disulfide isomerase/thioredoxin n=1 Tax=Evansella vedderi TaxID=38282 RepID=A0ABT9ZYM9_9BACI|nr:TlpA disulfide reductase family protein [Evansella vedderi]MDQ0256070.1 thiol-disulfide isomerase/thioredoxin [Evansella vedderi]